jgi:hypothetical protein
VAPSSTAEVTAQRPYVDGAEDTAVLTIHDGLVTVEAEDSGSLVVTQLELDLGQIHLTATQVPPNGLDLMDVKLTLRQAAGAQADWAADGDTASATGMSDLLLDWSLEGTGGVIVPLSTLRITNVPLDITVAEDRAGRLSLSLHAAHDGLFWDWPLIKLSNLRVDLQAAD